jgi:CheY-like chemotaxis protein
MSRILLVDDNAPALSSTAVVLTGWGHEVRLVEDGRAALVVVRTWVPELALVDIGLPGMDGIQLAAELRRQPALGGCRIIAMSALWREEDEARLHAADVDHFLRKPLEVSILHSLLGWRGRSLCWPR